MDCKEAVAFIAEGSHRVCFVGAACSIICWQPVECRSEFPQPDDDADIRYVDDTDVGADDRQRDVTEPGADDEPDVNVE